MKTKEEIEQLAEKEMMGMEGRFGFEAGYEKCQEDMADKKYTEEDMLKAFYAGVDCEFGGAPSFDQWIKKYKQD